MKRRLARCRVRTHSGRALPGVRLGELFAYLDAAGWTVERGEPESDPLHARIVREGATRDDAIAVLRAGGAT